MNAHIGKRSLLQQVPWAIDHGWRVFGTGLSFVVFGVGGVLLSLTLFPILRLVSWNETRARRRITSAMQLMMKAFIGLMHRLGLITYEVHNRERLDIPGQLIVANHPTLIDVVFLMSLTPQASCVVKQQLWRNPLLRWPVMWAGYIPNKSDPGAGSEFVERCAATLRAGRSLIVFPEGTRSVEGQPLQLKRGAAQIALASGASVLPITIVCRPLMLTKSEPWYRIPPSPGHFIISVGEPLAPSAYRAQYPLPSVAARHLTGDLASHFARAGL